MPQKLTPSEVFHLHSKFWMAPLNVIHARTLERSPRRCETIQLCEKPSTFVTGKSDEGRSGVAQAKAIVVSE